MRNFCLSLTAALLCVVSATAYGQNPTGYSAAPGNCPGGTCYAPGPQYRAPVPAVQYRQYQSTCSNGQCSPQAAYSQQVRTQPTYAYTYGHTAPASHARRGLFGGLFRGGLCHGGLFGGCR